MIDKSGIQGLLLKLAEQRSADFVGLGVIAYKTFAGLPVVPLGSHMNSYLGLPIVGARNVMSTLASLATQSSIMHDGFHLIEASSGDLTHVAQFVSPPLNAALANPLAAWPQGARQMTALLVSTLPQVEFSAVVSANGNVQIYVGGKEESGGVDR